MQQKQPPSYESRGGAQEWWKTARLRSWKGKPVKQEELQMDFVRAREIHLLPINE